MSYNWINPEDYTMDTLLYFDRWVLRYLLSVQPGGKDHAAYLSLVGCALWRHPHVVDYCRNKAPECASFVDMALAQVPPGLDMQAARQAETDFLRCHETFVVYAWPEAMERVDYIADWDRKWLDELIDLRGRVVLDVGAGTGRLAFAAARDALRVYASEPCDRLREYMRDRIAKSGITNMKVLDGTATCLPYEDATFDAVMSGHVVGDDYEGELREMRRVTRPGGWLVVCNGDDGFQRTRPDSELIRRGFEAFRHESPSGGVIFNYRLRV